MYCVNNPRYINIHNNFIYQLITVFKLLFMINCKIKRFCSKFIQLNILQNDHKLIFVSSGFQNVYLL